MSLKEEKQALRKEIKAKIDTHREQDLLKLSELIMHHLELDPNFLNAETVLLYWSQADEVHTHEFIERWSQTKTILLPKIKDNKMIAVPFSNTEEMESGYFNIAQPIANGYDGEIELVIVPGRAFDNNGHRLGRGKGFYDRFLSNYHGIKIGLCFPFQYTDYIPYESFDIPMDKVISGQQD